MTTATLTSKGRITLPRSVRERLGVGAGDRIEFIESNQGFLVVPVTRDISALKGLVPKNGKSMSVQTMKRAITRMGGRLP